MPETRRIIAIREIALSTLSFASINGNERREEGDIIVVRRPTKGIGLAECHSYLWLRLRGDIDVLDMFPVILKSDDESTFFDKRRFRIPFNRLPDDIDLTLVRNSNVVYQPFIPIDEETGLFIPGAQRRPLLAQRLIYDKKIGKFI